MIKHTPVSPVSPVAPAARPPARLWCSAALLWALLLTLLIGFVAPAPAAAQTQTWLERSTANFTILYAPGFEAEAEAYAGFVDGIYEEIAVLFDHRTATPLLLRLYPTHESYYQVNPTARQMTSIVAHADFRRREVAVILPQTELQTPDEIQNNIRHELTHIVASDLSDNQLNTGFQEGIAQYIELPTPELERKMILLARYVQENRLLSWSDFEDRDIIYGNPEISYPQTLSAVTFLIDTYGFETFQNFLTISAQSSGYRSALEQAYGTSPTDLEAAWRSWLPSFVDGTYVDQTGSNFDLSYARQLIDIGRYAEAQAELERAIEWLDETPQDDLQNEAQALLVRSHEGQQADALAADARAALAAADYEQARTLVEQARTAYAQIGDTRQQQVLEVYAARVERGLRATAQLGEAADLARSFRLPAARAEAEEAAVEFATLGDESRLNEALQLRNSMDSFQHVAGITLVVLGVVGILLSLVARWFVRDTEVW